MASEYTSNTLPTHRARRVKGLYDSSYSDLSLWPSFDEGALDEKKRQIFLKRKKGVIMYFSGYSDSDIKIECGIGLKQINRLIRERCLLIHSDGLIFGWRGLVPQKHIKPYQRINNIQVDDFGYGAVGAMQTLLSLHGDLKEKLHKRILQAPKSSLLGQINNTNQAIWKWFIDELKKLGYEQRNEWPFNTKSRGYYSVYRYINQVFCENPKKATQILGGVDNKRKFIAGDGVDRPVFKAFQRVEMDAHKIDGRFCVMMPTLQGDYHPKIIHRIWVIVIIEVMSKAVLGYCLSMGKEVSKDDVLRTIKIALSQWQPKSISFSEEAYIDSAGLPSSASNELIGICWDETNVDGALAETCKHVETVLKDVLGSTLMTPYSGYSSRRSKDDRPFVERFFKTLTSCGFQRLSNTTGSKPSDKKINDPDKVALTSQFQIEYAEELLDVLIANYNATPHSGLGHRSPLEYLQFITSRKDIALRRADEKSVQYILAYRKKCRVNGSLKEGRKPFVNFHGARYTNETLQQRFDLVDLHIWVVNHLEDDARVVEASTIEGQSLGILRAAPPWHKLPHTIKIRQAINATFRQRKFVLASTSDAVEAFVEYVESQPHSKLPVHPSYLEVRRILKQQANQDVGEAVLDKALTELINNDNETSIHSELQNKHENDSLPPRRMTASD